MNYFDNGNSQNTSTEQVNYTSVEALGQMTLPEQFQLANAQFERLGQDLKIIAQDGSSIVATGYFAQSEPESLSFANGVKLPGSMVEKLAGSIAPGQVVQAAGSDLAEPIGRVDTVEGTVEAVRADGTRVTLQAGDAVYQGDELVTGDDAAISVVFLDETTFALGEGGRMILDEMVYDPGGEDGALGMTLLSGAMSFVSGAVAKANPDAMQITTPVATIGIRGTGGALKASGDDVQIALIREGDGTVGEISVTSVNGDTVTLNVENGFVTANANGVSGVTIGTLQDIVALGGKAVLLVAKAGLLSQAIREAAEKNQEEKQQEGDVEVELNEADDLGVDAEEVLASFAEQAALLQTDLVEFFDDLNEEIDNAIMLAVEEAVAERGQYDAANEQIQSSVAKANEAQQKAADAETKIADATDDTATANRLSAVGVSDTDAVMDVVYASFDSFGAALSISSAAGSIAELAQTALYTTGEELSGSDLERLAAELDAAATAALDAANNVDTLIDAIISVTNQLLNDIESNKSNLETWISTQTAGKEDYYGLTFDEAVQLYAAERDNELIDQNLPTGMSLSDAGTYLDSAVNAIYNSNANTGLYAVVKEIQNASEDQAFLDNFEAAVSKVHQFVIDADSVVNQAGDLLTSTKSDQAVSTFLQNLKTSASNVRQSGLNASDSLKTLKKETLDPYRDAQNDKVDSTVADDIATLKQDLVDAFNDLNTKTAEYKAASNTGEAAGDFLDGVAQTNLYGNDWDTNNDRVLDNPIKTNGSEGAATQAQTDFGTAQTDLQTAISDLKTASNAVLNPLIQRATAEAKLTVLNDATGDALDQVQRYALEELEVNFENFVDATSSAVRGLQEAIEEARASITGTIPQELTDAYNDVLAAVDEISTIKDDVDGWSVFEGENEPTSAQYAAVTTSLGEFKATLSDLLSSFTTAGNALGSHATAQSFVQDAHTALDGMDNTINTAIDDFAAVSYDDVQNATYADGLNGSVGNINTAASSSGSAISKMAEKINELADSHQSSQTLLDRADTLDQVQQDSSVLASNAKKLTDVWEGAYTKVSDDRDTAQTDFDAAEQNYNNALSNEQNAQDTLFGDVNDDADKGALGDYDTAANNKADADADFAYDKTYLDVGEAAALQRAEKYLSDQESKFETAFNAALQAVEDAKTASVKAQNASGETTYNTTETQQAVSEAQAEQSVVEDALRDAIDAMKKAKNLDDATSSDRLRHAAPEDYDERYAAMEAQLDSLISMAQNIGSSYVDVNGNTVAFVADGTVAKLIDLTESYHDLAGARSTNTGVAQAQADVQTAQSNVETAQRSEALERADAAVDDAIVWDELAGRILADAESGAAVATVEDTSQQVYNDVQAILADIRNDEPAVQVDRDAAILTRDNLTGGSQQGDAAIGLAEEAETSAATAENKAKDLLGLGKELAKVIITWAVSEISAQLTAAENAAVAAEDAKDEATRLAGQINADETSVDDMTQEIVDDINALVNGVDGIVEQYKLALAERTKANDALVAAEAALDIAKTAAANYTEYADELQTMVDDISDIRAELAAAQRFEKNAETTKSDSELDLTLADTKLEARTQKEEAAAQEEADRAAARSKAEDDAQAESDAQSKADDEAEALAKKHADTAQEKAELAAEAEVAAQAASVKSDDAEAKVQYELAKQYAQEAQASADAASEAAAGHGSEALAQANRASGYAENAKASEGSAKASYNSATDSASSADNWRSGSTLLEKIQNNTDYNDAVEFAAKTQRSANREQTEYETAKSEAVQPQIDEAVAEASYQSRKDSEDKALDRLNQEIDASGLNSADYQIDLKAGNAIDFAAELTNAGLNSGKSALLDVWVDAYEFAKDATSDAQKAFQDAEKAASAALKKVDLAEQEATDAAKAALDAATKAGDLKADLAESESSLVLGRLAADQQAESAIDDALDEIAASLTTARTNSQNATNEAKTASDNAQDDSFDSAAAETAYNAAVTARNNAFSAKQDADSAVSDAQGAVNEFYVLKANLTDGGGNWKDGVEDAGPWIDIGSDGIYVIHQDSQANYNQALANVELAEKQASQVNQFYEIALTKANEASQSLATAQALEAQASAEATQDLQEARDIYDAALDRGEDAVDSAVGSNYEAIDAANQAMDDVAGLIDGTVPASVTTAQTSLTLAFNKIAGMKSAVDVWAADATDADVDALRQGYEDNSANDLRSLIAQAKADVQAAIDSGDVDPTSYAGRALAEALGAVTAAESSTESSYAATLDLETILDEKPTVHFTSPVEGEVGYLDASQAAIDATKSVTTPQNGEVAISKSVTANAKTSAQEAADAKDNLSDIDAIQEEKANADAQAKIDAVRLDDLNKAIAASEAADQDAQDAETAAAAAKEAYDAAVLKQTTAQGQADTSASAATFNGSDFTDLEQKEKVEQADGTVQTAMNSINQDVADALKYYQAAEKDAAAARAAATKASDAASDAQNAYDQGKSVSSYRKTAETEAKTADNKRIDAQDNRDEAQDEASEVDTNAQTVATKSTEAVDAREVFDISEAAATASENAQTERKNAQGDLNQLKDASDAAVENSKTAANEASAAADAKTADANADVSANRDAANTAVGNAQTEYDITQQELSSIETAYQEAVRQRDLAAEEAAKPEANDVAKDEYAAANQAVNDLKAIWDEAIKLDTAAKNALDNATKSLEAIDDVIADASLAAQTKQQAIDAFEGEAQDAADRADQSADRAEGIYEEIDPADGTPGSYDLAKSLASTTLQDINAWLADAAKQDALKAELVGVDESDNNLDDGDVTTDDYDELINFITDLRDRIDGGSDSSTDLTLKLDTEYSKAQNAASDARGAANDAATEYAKFQGTLTTAEAETAAGNATGFANDAQDHERVVAGQKRAIDGLYEAVKGVSERFDLVTGEVDQQISLDDAQDAALATPEAVDDYITGVAEDGSVDINVFADNNPNTTAVDGREDGGQITIVSVVQPEHGRVEIVDAANGIIRYTPDPDYSGDGNDTTFEDSFTYTIANGDPNDDATKYSTATVNLSIDPTNDNPVAVNDVATISDEISPVEIRLTVNDTDVDGDVLSIGEIEGTTVSSVGQVIEVYRDVGRGNELVGSVTVKSTKRIEFKPAEGAYEHLTTGEKAVLNLSYKVKDTAGALSDAGNVAITLTGTDGAPEINYTTPMSATFVEDGNAVNVFNTPGISDPEGAVIQSATIKSWDFTSTDTLVINGVNGISVNLTPPAVAGDPYVWVLTDTTGNATNADFDATIAGITYESSSNNPDGVREFSLTVTDGNNNSNTITETVTLSSVNDVPVAGTLEPAEIAEDSGDVTFTLAELEAKVSDPEGESTSIKTVAGSDLVSLQTTPVEMAEGTLRFDGTTFTFTPAENFNTGSPFYISYQAEDIKGAVSDGQIAPTITAVNDAPEIQISPVEVNYTEQGNPVDIFSSPQITDVDGDDIETATITGTNVNPDDVVSYNGEIPGINVAFDPATTTWTLTRDPNGQASNMEFEYLLQSFTFENQSDIPVEGTRSFSLVLNDGALDSNVVTQDINVTSSNDRPVVNDPQTSADAGVISEDPITNEGTLVSDIVSQYSISDADGETEFGIMVTFNNEYDGVLQYSLDNGTSWQGMGVADMAEVGRVLGPDSLIRYVPNSDFHGSHSFSFKIWDQSSNHQPGDFISDTMSLDFTTNAFGTESLTGSIQVTPVQDAPELGYDLPQLQTSEGEALIINESQFTNGVFIDADGESLSVVNMTVTDGAIVNNNDGTWTFTPPSAEFNGTIPITVTVTDGIDDTPGTFDIIVDAVNDAPSATALDTTPVDEDTSPVTFTLAELEAKVSDPENDPISIDSIEGQSLADLQVTPLEMTEGTLSFDGTTFTFTPAADYYNVTPLELTYIASDDGGLTSQSVVRITVNAVNDAPVYQGTYTENVDEDTPFTIYDSQIISQFVDAEGNQLTVSTVTADYGSVVNNNDGSWTITPDENYSGPVELNFTVSDGNLTGSGTGVLDVAPVNDAPVPQDYTETAEPGAVITFTEADLLTGATDVEGESLSVVEVAGQPVGGQGWTINLTNGTLDYDSVLSTFKFTPTDGGFTGSETFSFSVSDGIDTTIANTTLDYPNPQPEFKGIYEPLEAVGFNGMTDLVDAGRGNSDSFAIAGDLTVEAWVRPTDMTGPSTLMAMSGDPASALSADNTLYKLVLETDGSVTYSHEYGAGQEFTVTFDAGLYEGDWSSITLVRDADLGLVSLFVGGSEVPITAGSNANAPYDAYDVATQSPSGGENARLVMGGDVDGSGRFTGQVSEVAIWDREVQSPEIAENLEKTIHNPAGETNLKAYWRFDMDDDKDYVEDLSASGNDLRIQQGLILNGVDNYAQTTDALNISSHSATAWLKLDDVTSDMVFASASGDTYGGSNAGKYLDIGISADRKLFVRIEDNGSAKDLIGTTVLDDGDWHNVGYSYDAVTDTFSMYIDGELEVFTANQNDVLTNFSMDAPLVFGHSTLGDMYAEGEISQYAVYDAPLSDFEFNQVYNEGPDDIGSLSVVWRMEEGSGNILHADNHTGDANSNYDANLSGAADWGDTLPAIDNYASAHLQLGGQESFDGGNVGYPSDFIMASNWIKVDPGATNQNIMSLGNGLLDVKIGNEGEIILSLNFGETVQTLHTGWDYGEWFNVAVSNDANGVHLYIDGEERGFVNSTALDFTTASSTTYGTGFMGAMGEIQLWDGYADEQTVANRIDGVQDPSDSALLRYWKLDEGFGSTLSDSSTAGVNLGVNGVTNWQAGKPELAAEPFIDVDEDGSYSGRFAVVDPQEEPLTITVDTLPAHGTVVVDNEGNFTYTPAANYEGPDSFVISFTDGISAPVLQTINVNVEDEGTPRAFDDQTNVQENGFVDINVTANDELPDESSITSVGVPAHGSVQILSGGVLRYTPDAGYSGSDSFTYTLTDEDGDTSQATVHVTVDVVNGTPTVVDDNASTSIDAAVVIDVLANDSDPDGDNLTITKVDGQTIAVGQQVSVMYGNIVLNGDGTLTYTPNTGYTGSDSFTYEVSDGNGGIQTANVNVNIGGGNAAPIANDDTTSTQTDTAVNIHVLANDTDAEQDVLTVTMVDSQAIATGQTVNVANGSVTLNGDGSLTYVPTTGFNGTQTFSYEISDGNGGVSTADVHVNVGAGVSYNVVTGTVAAETLTGTAAADSMSGLDGDDVLIGGQGDDLLVGGVGSDTYRWSTGDGYDVIQATDDVGGLDVIEFSGGPFYDFNWHKNGDDLTVGVAGDGTYDSAVLGGDITLQNFFAGGDSVDYMFADVGTSNNDYYSATGSADGYAKITLTSSTTGVNQTSGTELVFGTDGNDTLSGNGGYRDYLMGGAGDDILNGSETTMDELRGGDGYDTMYGLSGDDRFVGGAGSDYMDGGAGFDTLRYEKESGSQGVTVNLSDQAENGVGPNEALDTYGNLDTVMNMEAARGTGFADTFFGSDGDNLFKGYDGDDVFFGGLGADTLIGGLGYDRFIYSGASESNTTTSDVLVEFDPTVDVIVLENSDHLTFESVKYASGVSDVATTVSDIYADANVATDTIVYFDNGVNTYMVVKTIAGDPYEEFFLVLTDTVANIPAAAVEQTSQRTVIEGDNTVNSLVGGVDDEEFLGLGDADTITTGTGSDAVSFDGASDSDTSFTDYVTDFDTSNDVLTFYGGDNLTFNPTKYAFTTSVADTIAAINADSNIANNAVVHFDDTIDTFVFVKAQTGDLYENFLVRLSDPYLNLTTSNFEFISPRTNTSNPVQNTQFISGEGTADILTGTAGDDEIMGHGGADTISTSTGYDRISFNNATHSNTTDFDVITDFDDSADQLTLYGGDNLTFVPTPFAFVTSLTDTITAIEADVGISTGSVIFFTDGADGYVYVKDTAGSEYQSFLVKLQGKTSALTASNLDLQPISNTPESIIEGDATNNDLGGTAADDDILGYAGDDTLSGKGGDDALFGGDGTDTAAYQGFSNDYEISQNGAVIKVRDVNVATLDEGYDDLISIENVYFDAEGTIADQQTVTVSQASEIEVGQTHGIVEYSADIAGGRDGEYAIVWRGTNVAQTSNEIYLQFTNDDGSNGALVTVASGMTTVDMFQPRVAILEDGTTVVTWVEEKSSDPNNYKVMARAFDQNGTEDTRWGAGAFEVGSVEGTTGASNIQPSISSTDQGGFIIAWDNSSAGNGDLQYRNFYFDGNSSTGTSLVNTTNAETDVEIVSAPGGNWAAIYREAIGSDDRLMLNIYDGGGTVLASNIIVAPSVQLSNDHYDIDVLNNGDFIISWTEDVSGDGMYVAKAAIYGQDGQIRTQPFNISPDNGDPETVAMITALEDGRFVSVWQADYMDGDAGGIFGRIFNSDGSPAGDMFLINETTQGNQTLPRVDAVSNWYDDTAFVVVWDGPNTSSGRSIYKQTFNSDGQIVGGLTLTGTTGDDIIRGGEGTQVFIGDEGADTLYGGFGEDVFIAGAGADVIYGGDGTTDDAKDTLDFSNIGQAGGGDVIGVTVDMAVGSASYDGAGSVASATSTISFEGIEQIKGSSLNDTITGSANADVIDAGAGDDVIDTAAGDDYILASLGNDVINGNLGSDWLSFDTDFTTTGISVDLNVIGDGAIGGTGDQTVSADFGSLDLSGIENIEGTIDADIITGDAANNRFSGLEGTDTISGGAGTDWIEGGMEQDTLSGGADADTFYFNDMGDVWDATTDQNVGDIITDFVSGQDVLEFNRYGFDELYQLADGTLNASNFEVISGATAPLQATTSAGTPTFILHDDTSGNSVLYYDADGSGSGYSSTKIAEFTNDAIITADDIKLTTG